MAPSRGLLVTLLAFLACRAVPSSVPLADSGERRPFDEGALARNRVSSSERSARPKQPDPQPRPEPEPKTAELGASPPDAGVDAAPRDAGPPASDAGKSEHRWAGEYFGFDRHVTRVGTRPEEVVTDDKAHTRVEQASPESVVISLVSSADGTVICAMRARVEGARATLEPGERCPGLLMMPPLTVEGSATLDGDRLVVDLAAHGEFGEGGDANSVRVEYHFDGERR